jgi:hypothetical protein
MNVIGLLSDAADRLVSPLGDLAPEEFAQQEAAWS